MVLYRRSLRPGATYFFTLTLRDRSSSVLTDNIRVLGSALRTCRARHPFSMMAIVVLPEHLHCMWALPDDDSGYSIRWALIKAAFTRITRSVARRSGSESVRYGSRDSGSTRYATSMTLSGI
jgi:putative transposase